ncbi:hypothetical protein F4825DRAFT_476932 [Nemania diffusa]|nr:hypothetical protein F4825DRAFT_476932 [Nemania diffusa]
MGQSFSAWQQRRSANTLRELAPRRTPGQEVPIPNLTRDILLKALSTVASFITEKGGDVTVVAVGGAVNTIHLQSRMVTHDVDFFNSRMTTQEIALLVDGAKATAKRTKGLEGDWFNNRTILFMPHEVIFYERGLKILAAPWNYAFYCKVDRISGGGIHGQRYPQVNAVHGAREYDLDDACHYLLQYVRSTETAQIKQSTIYTWFSTYQLRRNAQVGGTLDRVNVNCRNNFDLAYDIIVA